MKKIRQLTQNETDHIVADLHNLMRKSGLEGCKLCAKFGACDGIDKCTPIWNGFETTPYIEEEEIK